MAVCGLKAEDSLSGWPSGVRGHRWHFGIATLVSADSFVMFCAILAIFNGPSGKAVENQNIL